MSVRHSVAQLADVETDAAPARVYTIDPFADPRWKALVERHPQASVFHSIGWLDALRRTYKYQPKVVTTAAPGQPLTNGMVFCSVNSWLTGQRLVSLPFSDHCHPLVQNACELRTLLAALGAPARRVEVRSIELVPTDAGVVAETPTFVMHSIDLRPTVEQLFSHLHKDCVQRKIRRAHREGLTLESGRSEAMLSRFYHLLEGSRKRQKVPPQPRRWYRNLVDCMGDDVTVHVASKAGQPIASILTLRHRRTMVYKYGASERQFNNLGGMQMLLWHAIEQARADGCQEFDLGRSDWDNPGLIQFKDRWGAARSRLYYLRSPNPENASANTSRRIAIIRQLASHAPERLVAILGRQLYRHFGCV